MITLSRQEWEAAGVIRYGIDRMRWKFRCPCCGHIATPSDYKSAGAPENAVAFSCVGRWAENGSEAFSGDAGPCNYAGGGLFRLNPITVTDGANKHEVFDFADPLSIKARVE
jgi:hypothetical protein